MIAKLVAMIVLSVAPLIHTLEASHQISLTLVDVGDNVTFDCNISDKDFKFVYWYKQSLGYMVESVASVVVGQPKLSEKFKGSRFALRAEDSRYTLTISDVRKEDEATYLCQTGTTHSQEFIYATFLAVTDHKHQKSLYLEQHPDTELVQQEETVILQCSLLSKNKGKVSCRTKPSVFWFRAESQQFHPGIIYTQRNISGEDLERSCSYSLYVRDSSDAEIYYSAVVTCGSILFDERTNVKEGQEVNGLVIALGGLLTCCVIVVILLICYIKLQKKYEQSKGQIGGCSLEEDDKPAAVQSRNWDDEANYASVQTRTRRANEKRELPQECVYSDVRSHDHQNHLSSF
ncbi:uncharacterized protein LOC118557430 isoform X2 [Fundulus heteroclitus]|uniref:uncharacterized protein LOC118557430 isoform X2 n=1 Tax=Fundulus heteroclitus TaxID=8078 RepID=UPI00165C1759|nr:uncharacterized protein LOC118557430 isoform X2 [Fundulus heteroclitus]